MCSLLCTVDTSHQSVLWGIHPCRYLCLFCPFCLLHEADSLVLEGYSKQCPLPSPSRPVNSGPPGAQLEPPSLREPSPVSLPPVSRQGQALLPSSGSEPVPTLSPQSPWPSLPDLSCYTSSFQIGTCHCFKCFGVFLVSFRSGPNASGERPCSAPPLPTQTLWPSWAALSPRAQLLSPACTHEVQLSVDSHVRMEGSANAQMLVPVQTAGWVASVKSVSLSSYLTNCVLRFYFEF